MTTKKRNPQDATRARDVTPLRKRIAELEQAVKDIEQRLELIEQQQVTDTPERDELR